MAISNAEMTLQTILEKIENLKVSLEKAKADDARAMSELITVLQTDDENAYRDGLRRHAVYIDSLNAQLKILESKRDKIMNDEKLAKEYNAMSETERKRQQETLFQQKKQTIQKEIETLEQRAHHLQVEYNTLYHELPSYMQTEDEGSHRRLMGRTQDSLNTAMERLKTLQSQLAQMLQTKAMLKIRENINHRFQLEMKAIDEEQKMDKEWDVITLKKLIETYTDPATTEIAKNAVRINNHPLGGLHLRRVWEDSTLHDQALRFVPEGGRLTLANKFKDPMMSDYSVDRTQLVSVNDEVLLVMIACRNVILKNPSKFMEVEGQAGSEEGKELAEIIARYFASLSESRITEGEQMLESFQQGAYSKHHVNIVYCMFRSLCDIKGPKQAPLMSMNNLGAMLQQRAPTTIDYQTNPYQLKPALALSTIDSLAIATLKYDFNVTYAPATNDEMQGADHHAILHAIETGVFIPIPKAPVPPLCPQFTQAQYQASIKNHNDEIIAGRKPEV